jgi:hypothetical protein
MIDRLRFRQCGTCLLLCLPVLALSQTQKMGPSSPIDTCVHDRAAGQDSPSLVGRWRVQLWSVDQAETSPPNRMGWLKLSPHPEYGGSVLGRLELSDGHSTEQSLASGDLLAQTLNLDESFDGVNTDAMWEGAPAAVACSGAMPVLSGLRLPVTGRQKVPAPFRFRLVFMGSANP